MGGHHSGVQECPTYNERLSNLEEYNAGTNPCDWDTVSDLMSDAWEIQNNLNPLVDDANEDPDSDTLTNLDEYGFKTNPRDSDSDSDTFSDDWEISNWFDPLDPWVANSYMKLGQSWTSLS